MNKWLRRGLFVGAAVAVVLLERLNDAGGCVRRLSLPSGTWVG